VDCSGEVLQYRAECGAAGDDLGRADLEVERGGFGSAGGMLVAIVIRRSQLTLYRIAMGCNRISTYVGMEPTGGRYGLIGMRNVQTIDRELEFLVAVVSHSERSAPTRRPESSTSCSTSAAAMP
jgi:hypothetical protein